MKKSIDMLHGPLGLKILLFALPIALSSMLQQLFNAADTSIVGYFANANALAAVGTNGEIVALLVTLSAGLAIGSNVLIAKHIGENATTEISDIIHTSIAFAILLGCAGAIAGQVIARPLLIAIQTPSAVLDAAVIYLRIYFASFPFLLLYDFGSAILRAKGDSRRPFIALTTSGILNVFLNLFFVIVCRLNVAGVAIATVISTMISAFMVLGYLFHEPASFHLSLRKIHLTPKHLISILIIGVPSAVQGAVFCFANMFVQASVNSFGAIATAGTTIAMNFEYFEYYIITAFGQAATTFTSQNFAAGEKKRCQKVLALSLALSLILSVLVTLPLTIFHTEISGFFSSEQTVIEAAAVRIMLIFAFEPLCCFYEIPAGFLRGSGHSFYPAITTIIGTCVLRIIWIFTVFRHFHTLESLFVIFPISWVITSLMMFIGILFYQNTRRI